MGVKIKKRKKRDPNSVSFLKEKLWKLFSEYIRRRDAAFNDYVKCVSCPVMRPWKQMHAGHFIPGHHPSVVYDERNSHAQCYSCNIEKKGNWVNYYQFMRNKYGQEVIDELIEKDKEMLQRKSEDYKILIELYTEKLGTLSK